MIRQRPARPIARKLALLVTASLATAVLAFAGFSAWTETRRYVEMRRDALLGTAAVFASVSSTAVAGGDRTATLQALRAIGRIPGLLHGRVETPEGRVFAALGQATRLDSDPLLGEGARQDSVWEVLTSRTIQVSAPIYASGTPVARLVLVADTSGLPQVLQNALLAIVAAAAAAAALGFAIAGRLQRRITAPIHHLTAAIARIGRDHDYAVRVEARSDDEVGLLVDGFNAMLGEIRARDERLEAHRQGLEAEVLARTQDLAVARDSAEAANRAKSDFLATMSHEIRTPMNGILVMAELLAGAPLPDRQRRYAEIIAHSGKGLLAIINDVLDFSKIESGKLELERLPVDPVALVDDVMGLFAGKARDSGLDLAAVAALDLPARIEGDPTRLHQILANLVNNAIKFTERGTVTVTAGRSATRPGAIEFAVRDTGIGIAPGRLPHLFSAFTQAEQSTTRRFGGTGLGLAICRRLADAMGAAIEVESEPGRGSVFRLVLPAGEARPAPWPRLADAADGRAPLVALAVASEPARGALRLYAEAAGARVLEVSTPAGVPPEACLLVADASALADAGPRAGGGPVVALAPLGDDRSDAALAAGRALRSLGAPVSRREVETLLADLAAGRVEQQGRPAVGGPVLPRFEGLKVLAAEDGAVNREVLAEALGLLGVRPDFVDDGAAALEALARRRYDLVLMDGSMPVLDGFEATRRLRAREAQAGLPRLPVVALTAHVLGAASQAWREAGMDGVLHKPFTLRALAETLAAFAPAAQTSTADVAEPAPVLPAPAGPVPEAARAEPAGGEDPAVDLDPAKLAELDALARSGRPDFAARVFGLYREHAPQSLAAAEAAAATGDGEALARAAHALKSMSHNIGALRVAAAAAALEQHARGAEPPGPDDVAPLARRLAAALAAVEARLAPDRDAPAAEPLPAPPADPDLALAAPLAEAIAADRLSLVYQPQVDRSGAIQTVEALVRWTLDGVSIPPFRFVPLAERTGQIAALGAWVLARACREASAWSGVRLAVNVSAVEICRPDFVDATLGILAREGFDPRRLEIEITETAIIHDEAATLDAIRRLKAAGVTFALDDFGTGYSSLMHLRRYPFDRIKIDRDFVAGVTAAVDAATIVHAVVGIGRSLGMKVIAEGVETVEQQKFLQAAGVHLLQGYLTGRPMPAADLGRLVPSGPRLAAG
ncbi:EAL domain-containing protein [Prosthecomicrobium sp. N25]|uniref:EAL domain-containing protein n=1 Tax=Prosthecomicrobium sp. N25 TaxID=3129254 RepID=UPI003076A637